MNDSKISGHIKHEKEKNPIWITNETEEKKLLMLCNGSGIEPRYCILCEKSYEKIKEFEKKMNHNKKITWFVCKNGFIAGKTYRGILYIHQIIMDVFRKNIIVSHIDNNSLNNTFVNLHLESISLKNPTVSREEHKQKQYINTSLPDGITSEMLKEYVVYYFNIYNLKKNKYRDFFRVEGHPKQKGCIWETSKSEKKSIFEKLKQANEYVECLDLL